MNCSFYAASDETLGVAERICVLLAVCRNDISKSHSHIRRKRWFSRNVIIACMLGYLVIWFLCNLCCSHFIAILSSLECFNWCELMCLCVFTALRHILLNSWHLIVGKSDNPPLVSGNELQYIVESHKTWSNGNPLGCSFDKKKTQSQ